jgi:DEAD/DEAH box helicase domain-containing protein
MYSHQAKAINDLWDKNHVIVSTSTASGKSLIYQVPVLDALERDPDVKALYIFPTKALAQDQKKSLVNILSNMAELSHILVETFDGDTPQANRARIRENASGKPGTSISYS